MPAGISSEGTSSEVQRQKERNKIRKVFKMRSFLIDIYSAMTKFIKMHQHKIRCMTSKSAGILVYIHMHSRRVGLFKYCCKNFCETHKKTPAMQSFLRKVAGCTSFAEGLHFRCFLVFFRNFLERLCTE